MKAIKNIVAGLATVLALSSCGGDFLDTDYKRYLGQDEVGAIAADDPTAFLNGIWSWMVNYDPLDYGPDEGIDDTWGYMSILHVADLNSSDMLMSNIHWFNYDYQMDNRMSPWRRPLSHWTILYGMVDRANTLISLYPNGPQNDAEKVVAGQAKAVRGLAYLMLIQLFQNPIDADGNIAEDRAGVPIIYTAADGKTAAEMDEAKGRNTVKDVLAFIEKDLTDAVSYLTNADYARLSKNNIDANVANGLLARYYLLTQQWDKAASAANTARQGYKPMSLDALHDGFLDIKNAEWMWGFEHNAETTTLYASFFSHVSNLESGYAGLGFAPRCIDAMLYSQIPDDDERKTLFNGPDGDESQPTAAAQLPYANLKFGSDGELTEDYVYMRAAEMYLIEAEALVRQGDKAKAATVLGELMANRQPSWEKKSVTLNDILLQRRIELWGEGFAFFDLKRTNRGFVRNYEGTNHVAGAYTFDLEPQDPAWTYQIPDAEIQENTHISNKDQND